MIMRFLGGRALPETERRASVRSMTTFVLVHGAWGGSWGFRLGRRPLREGGHEVFTPSLTGIGERAHLASPQVNLSTHVLDVVNTILYEDLTDIVLLGFSYGGMVVTGALEHVADRVSHLVYLDAFVPADGQSLDDLSGAGYRQAAVGPGATWLVEPIARPLRDSEESAWSAARRSPHPVGCFTEPVRLERPLVEYPLTRTYIKATQEPRPVAGARPSAFWTAADNAKASQDWRYHEVDSDHVIPLNRPDDLAAILLGLA
jgi:pimeloyl-ACP methyl ester carboxylesterase